MAKKKKSGSHNHLSAPAVTSTAPTTPTTPTPAPTLATTTTTTTTTNDENSTTTSNKPVDLVDKGSTSTASTSTEPLSTEVSTESSTSVSESSTSTVSSTDATIINENIHKEEDEQQQAQSTSTPTDTADTTDTTDTTTTHAEDTTSITSTNSLPFSKPSGFTRRGPKSATLNLSKDAAIVIAARRAVSRANVLDSGMMDSSSLPSSASGTPRRKSLGTDSILLESNDNDNTDDDNNQNNNSNNNNNNDNNDNNNNYMDRENYSQNHNKKFSSPNPILRRGSSNSILKTDVVRSSSLPNEGSSRPSSSTRLLEIANLFISSLSKSRRSIEVERNTTEINIVEVKDLSLDSNLNPYCKLVFKDQSYTTKAAITSHNDASPFQWREWTTFDFYNSISTPEQTQNLSIEVFNQDSVIGTTTVDLGTLSINKWVDMWLDLLTDANDATSVCGKIHLKFKRTLFSRNNSTTGSTDDESSNTSSKRSSIMDTSDDGEPEDEKGPPGKLQRSGRQGSMMKKYINLWRNQYPNHEGVQQLNNTTDSAGSAPPSPSPSAGDSDVPPLDPILSAAPTVPALSVTPSTPLNPNPSVLSTPAHSTALKATNNTNPMMATPVSGYAPSPAVTAPSSSSASSTFGLDDDKKHINVGRRGSVRHKAGSAPVLFLKIFLVAFNETKRIDFAGVVGRSELKDAFYKTFPDYPFPDPFPKVYIRDKQAGIFYELENYAEVTEGSVLQLYTAPEQSVLETRISGLQKTLDEVVKRLSSSSSSSSTSAPHELSYPLLKAQASTDFRPISAATTPTVTPAGSAPLSASTASGSPIENTPTPLQSLKTAIKPALTQIDALKRQVATLRQSYRHEHTTAMANLTSTFEHLSSTLKRSLGEHAAHLFKRSQLATRKDKHMTHYQQLTTKLNETETLVNELTQDVVVHKCKPDAAMISTLLSDLENLDKGITDIHDTYEDLERSFKSVWAKELKNVVNEESFFKAAVDDLDDMDEQYDELANTVKTLQQLINVKATLPTKLPEFHVEDLESRSDTVAGLMQEIVSVAPDHEARMKRLEVAEQLRAKHKAVERAKSPIQEFEDSLASKGSSLRKTGGVDELERKRRLRDQEMLKAIANSSST